MRDFPSPPELTAWESVKNCPRLISAPSIHTASGDPSLTMRLPYPYWHHDIQVIVVTNRRHAALPKSLSKAYLHLVAAQCLKNVDQVARLICRLHVDPFVVDGELF